MKFFLLIFLLILNNCSFDNKTGIWKNVNETSNKQTKVEQNFKILSSSKDPYSEIIPKKNLKSKKFLELENDLLQLIKNLISLVKILKVICPNEHDPFQKQSIYHYHLFFHTNDKLLVVYHYS